MLEKIETREIMTLQEAQKRYSPYYFIMIVTERVDMLYNDLGYVLYIADTDRELSKVPREEYKGKQAAFWMGEDAEPYPIVENVVYYD